MKRENAQELAELDVSNIITTQGNCICIPYCVLVQFLDEYVPLSIFKFDSSGVSYSLTKKK